MLKRGLKLVVLYLILVAPGFAHQAAESDEKLASDFWSWRGRYAQYTGDDVPRMERPASVVRAWSAASVEGQRKELAAFDERSRNQGGNCRQLSIGGLVSFGWRRDGASTIFTNGAHGEEVIIG